MYRGQQAVEEVSRPKPAGLPRGEELEERRVLPHRRRGREGWLHARQALTSATKGGAQMAKKSGVVQTLKKASQGLLFLSETDAPFEAFAWEGEEGEPDKARVLELAGLPPKTPIATKSLDAFFADLTQEQAWHDQKEKEEVARFQQLVQALKDALSDVKVFLVGKRPERDVFIVGKTESGWAGLKTKVVET